MKNPIIILITIVLLSVLGVGAYSLFQKSAIQKDSMMKNDETKMENTSISDEGKIVDEKNSSRYVEYSKAVLENTQDKKRVLYFYANWCPICKPADEDFRQNEERIPEDVVVIRVNYNDTDTDQEEKDLARQYGITYQHTFVQIDSQGNEVAKWNGGQVDELLENMK